MVRLKERLSIARKALDTLLEILGQPRTPIVRDASIQRFEYTFEAVWKAAQLYLRAEESLAAGSPKAAIRISQQVGLLSGPQARIALEMADDRNLTVHTYNEDLAERICSRIPLYAELMEGWLSAMLERTSGG